MGLWQVLHIDSCWTSRGNRGPDPWSAWQSPQPTPLLPSWGGADRGPALHGLEDLQEGEEANRQQGGAEDGSQLDYSGFHDPGAPAMIPLTRLRSASWMKTEPVCTSLTQKHPSAP